jgi:ligand-binding sensor domain-containing protein/anti-sigma regulatory factor (Ser/Thr protein kinase)
LSYYDQAAASFRHFISDSSNQGESPVGITDKILIDDSNNAWIGISGYGLWHCDSKNAKFRYYGQLPHVNKGYSESFRKHLNRLSDMHMDDSGILWMATADGLYAFDPEKSAFTVYRPEPDTMNTWKKDVFNTFLTDSAGNFWLGGWGTGLNFFNRSTNEWKHFDPNPSFSKMYTKNIVSQICWKSSDEIWVGTNDTGLCVFNILGQKFYYPSRDEKLKILIPDFHAYRLYIDKRQNLWIAYPEGLHMLPEKAQTFEFISEEVSHSDNGEYYGVTSVYIDSLHSVRLTGTSFADGIGITDLKTGRRLHVKTDLWRGEDKNILINAIYRDSRKTVWVLTRDYVYHYDPLKRNLQKIEQPIADTGQLRSPYYSEIAEDHKGRIWITGGRFGLTFYDPVSKNFKLINRSNSELPENSIWGITKDKKGFFWTNTNNLIVAINPDDFSMRTFQLDKDVSSGLDGTKIHSVRADDDGILWIATSSGLFSLDTETDDPEVNTEIAGGKLKGYPVYDIGISGKNVVFTSVYGLSIMNAMNGNIRSYSDRDGLTSLYQNFRILPAGNGYFYLCTFKGYYLFHPDSIRVSGIVPKVFLNTFKVFDREKNITNEIDVNHRINLSPSENFFSLEFTSPDLHQSQEIMFSYRLKGFDDEWSPVAPRRYASFTNVPGGNYTFEVRAVNRDGIWSDVVSVPIHVDTVYYKRPVFIALFSLLVAGVVYMLYRYRIRVIQRAEHMKTKFHQRLAETEMRALRAQMNPHFIFNCLNSINRYIIKNDQKTASLYLTKFARLIRLILENSEAGMVPLSQELEALKLYIDIEALRFDHKFGYEINVADEIQADTILVPTMILQPYVENAIWHGLLHKDGFGQLSIRVAEEDDALVCIIEDNGIGRENAMAMQSKTSVTRKSMGLKITADRLAMLNGRAGYTKPGVEIIDLRNENGDAAGTRVIIHIPTETEKLQTQ